MSSSARCTPCAQLDPWSDTRPRVLLDGEAHEPRLFPSSRKAALMNLHESNTTWLSLYRTMQTIRQCEEELARCHQRGLVLGACHTYVGEEAIAPAVCAHLGPDDPVFSTHRGHGHALAKGAHPRELIAELFGRETG